MNKNFSIKGFHLLILLLISSILGYYIGVRKVDFAWKNYQPIMAVQSKTPPPTQNLDMSLFYNVLEKVNKDYYNKEKLNSQKILYGAIQGMLQSLEDPYTSFFPPKENTSFKTQLAGQFEGIGAELGMSKENRIMVVAPLDGSPAQKSGIKTGDLILKVDGSDTTGWTLSQAVEKIRGEKGTNVVLNVFHEGAKASKDVSIKRDVIVVKSVTSWIKQVKKEGTEYKISENCSDCSSIAYIRLSQFGDKTNEEWLNNINSLIPQIKNQKNFKGIILDLRNNPGGYLNDAVFISSEFLKNGVVVKQEDNSGEQRALDVSREGKLLDYPLIVLVNKGSASASEIVAGALRDHSRAKLLGEKSFGKGTVQEAVELGNGASVHVSVAKWLTPNGIWVNQNEGLEPDIKVELKVPENEEMKLGNPEKMDNQLQKAIEELSK